MESMEAVRKSAELVAGARPGETTLLDAAVPVLVLPRVERRNGDQQAMGRGGAERNRGLTGGDAGHSTASGTFL